MSNIITLQNVSKDAVELMYFFDEQVNLGGFAYGEAAYKKVVNDSVLVLQLEYCMRTAVVHVKNKDDNNFYLTIHHVTTIRHDEHEMHIDTVSGNKLIISQKNNCISCVVAM